MDIADKDRHKEVPGDVKNRKLDVQKDFSPQSIFWTWYHRSFIVKFLTSITPWVMRTLPRWFVQILRRLFFALYYFLGTRFRRAVRGNLMVALGDSVSRREIRRTTRGVFSNVTRSFVDLFYTTSVSQYRRSDIVDPARGMEYVYDAAERGDGAIFLTGHIGNWELGGMALSQDSGRDVYMVYLPDRFEAFDRLRENARMSKKVKSIPMVRDSFETSLKIIRILRSGDFVAMKGDRALMGDGITTKFFGKDTVFPKGPYLLSYISGSPILPTFIVMDNGKYLPIIERPIYPEKTGDMRYDVENLVEKVARIMEEYIRRYPDQWYMFYPFWKE